MADKWLGWCAKEEREALRSTLAAHDPRSTLLFVESEHELRQGVRESVEPVGALVGPVTGGVSAVNVAAAVCSDGMAQEVILAVHAMTPELVERAKRAKITKVVELSSAGGRRLDDLDEPSEQERHAAVVSDAFDEPVSPTLIMLPSEPKASLEQRVPRVEQGAQSTSGERHPIPRLKLATRSEDKASLAKTSPLQSDLPWERHDEGGEANAPVIVLVSGRGGVGKTSLVATMATAAASWGMSVAVLDLDLSSGDLYNALGLAGPADLSALLEHEVSSREDVIACGKTAGERIRLWGCCELPEMAEPVMPRVEDVLVALRSCSDLVLVDTSVALTDAVAQAAQACDRLAIVVDGRPGSSAAQRRLGALAVRLGVARTRIVRLANRCGPRGKGEPIINRADIGLETARPLRVLDGGIEVGECLGEGKPQDLFSLGSKFAESAAGTLASLLVELGKLPDCPEAHEALEQRDERSLWGFAHRKGA